MPTYVFRDVAPLRGLQKLDAQKVGEAIEKVKDAEDQAEALWKAAQSRRHPLHACYEWDVDKAAEAHWRDTSRKIMRCIYVTDEKTGDDYPAFINIKTDNERRFYQPTEIIRSLDLQHALMKAARRDLEAFRKRYSIFGDICSIVSEAEAQLKKRMGEGDRATE